MKKLVVVFIILLYASGIGFYLYTNQNFNAKTQSISPPENIDAKAEKKNNPIDLEASARKDFNILLDDFQKQVKNHITEYKKKRRVVNETVKPANLTEAEFIYENNRILKSTISELENDMEGFMSLFSETDQKMKNLVSHYDEETELDIGQSDILQTWTKVREENLNKIMDFFIQEQEKLESYVELSNFYTENAQILEVDLDSDEIHFPTQTLNVRHAYLKKQTK